MATDRRWDPRRFDVRSFAAEGGTLSGEWPLISLSRLASAAVAESLAAAAPVHWQAQGLRAKLAGAGAQATLLLGATATLSMQCQRCLQPVEVGLDVDRRIFFVEGEDTAAALDVDSDDDVLALEPAADLLGLVEDELLLALPLIPRHAICPEPLVSPASDDTALPTEEHPFAALAALRRGHGPD